MAEKFEGFANAPVDEKTGERLDFRDVDAFVDESDEGQKRVASQTTPSSIVAFKTDDKSTDDAPAAVVPAPEDEADGFEDDLDLDYTDYEDGDEVPETVAPSPDGEPVPGPVEPQEGVVPGELEDAAQDAEADAKDGSKS
jgi:hypothetical protein